MPSLLHRSIFVLLTITMAACTSVGDPPGAGGSGGTAGSGGAAGTGGIAGTGGTAGTGGSAGTGATAGTGGAAGTGGMAGTGGSSPSPTVTLTATPLAVATGTKTALSWTSTNATECTASSGQSEGWKDMRLPEGGPEDQFVYEDTRYELTCQGPGGEFGTDHVDVPIDTSQLLVSVDMSLYLVKAGDTFDVNVTVSNPGSVIVQNVFVFVVIPQYVIINVGDLLGQVTCTGDCEEGDIIEWDIGSVGPGNGTVVSVESEVSQTVPDGEDIQFEVTTMADDQPDAVVTENTSEGESDLGLGLAQTPSQPEAGDVIVYTLSYDNSGADPLPNVELTLTLPDQVIYVSSTDSGTEEDGVVTWALGTLLPGASGEVAATAEVNAALPPGAQLRAAAGASVDGTSVRARATTVGAPGDGTSECLFSEDCPSGEVCNEGSCVPRLVAEVEVNPNPAKPDEVLHVAVTVSNPTTSETVNDINVAIPVPAGLKNILTSHRPGGSCTSSQCYSGQTVSWAVASLGPGESTTVWMTPIVASATATGTEMQFDAEVTSSSGAAASGSSTTIVDDEPTFGLRVAQSANPVRPGQPLTYIAHFANRSTQTLNSLDLTATVPQGATFVSASDGGSHSGGIVTWTAGPLAPGEGSSRQYTVAVSQSARLGSQLRAELQAMASSGSSKATTQTQVAETPLVAAVEIYRDAVRAGGLFNVNITVSNPSSNTTVDDIEINVPIPGGLGNFGSNQRSSGGVCTSSQCYAGQRMIWTVGSLAPHESVIVTLEPIVRSTVADGWPISFQAQVDAADQVPVRAAATTLVQSDLILPLRSVESANPVRPGQALTYTLHFTNRSNQTVSSFALTATVPKGATFASASDAGSESGGVVSWTVGPLAPGEGSTREFTVAVASSVPLGSQLRSEAEAVIGGSDANRSRAVTVTQVAQATLVASTEIHRDPVTAGGLFNVNITVSNPSSTTTVNDIRIEAPVPGGLNNIGSSQLSPGGTCTSSQCYGGQRLKWSVDSLAPGESVIVSVEPVASSSAADGWSFPFQAQVYAAGEIPIFSEATSLVQSDRILAMRSVESANPVLPGADLTYTHHFSNVSNQTVSSFDLTATVPERATFVSASDGGSESGGVVGWIVGPLGPGESGTRQFTVAVDSSLPLGAQLYSQAEAVIEGNDANRARSVTATQVADATLIASTEINPDPTTASEWFHVNITVSNPSSTTTANDIQIEVPVPGGLGNMGNSQLSPGGTCTSSQCYGGQRLKWSFDSLAPGESVVVSVQPAASSAAADGWYFPFQAQVYAAGETPVFSDATSLVQSDRILQLSSVESANPVLPGANLTYTHHVANVSSQTVNSFELTATVPEGATFVSASDGGSESGGVVSWTAGPLGPGITDTRELTVTVDSGATLGSQLRSQAEAVIGGSDAERARSVTETPVSASLLTSTAVVTPDPAAPNQQLSISINVTNPSSTNTVNDISIELPVPPWLNNILTAQISTGGSCTSSQCYAGQRIRWPVASLAPGESVLVSIDPVVRSTAPSGTLLRIASETTVGGQPVTAASATLAVE